MSGEAENTVEYDKQPPKPIKKSRENGNAEIVVRAAAPISVLSVLQKAVESGATDGPYPFGV